MLAFIKSYAFGHITGNIEFVFALDTVLLGKIGEPAFFGVNGIVRLQAKACSDAIIGETSGLNCTDVDWTACDVVHKLPGVVPLTVELYRQGSVTFSWLLGERVARGGAGAAHSGALQTGISDLLGIV